MWNEIIDEQVGHRSIFISLKWLYEVLVNSYHTSNTNYIFLFLGWSRCFEGYDLCVLVRVGKIFSHNPLFHDEMLQTKQVPSVSVPAVHFHLYPSLSLPHFLSCENIILTYKWESVARPVMQTNGKAYCLSGLLRSAGQIFGNILSMLKTLDSQWYFRNMFARNAFLLTSPYHSEQRAVQVLSMSF